MDPQSQQPVILPQQPQPQKKPVKAFLLLEVGLFEVGFVLVLLGLIFGILNYFNILKLSTAIPALSFLPHIPVAQPQIPHGITAIPTGTFLYDTKNASTLIENFAKQNLTNEYLPTSQASESAFLYIQDKNIFTSPWNIANGKIGTASASINAQEVLTLQENTNTPSMYQLTLQSYSPPIFSFPNTLPEDAASRAAQKILKKLVAQEAWKCQGSYSKICTLTKKTPTDTFQYVISMQQDTIATTTAIMSIHICANPIGMPIPDCTR